MAFVHVYALPPSLAVNNKRRNSIYIYVSIKNCNLLKIPIKYGNCAEYIFYNQPLGIKSKDRS